jgi:disulfide oxidoreductase YuzD
MDYMYSMVLIEQTIVASGKIDTRKNNRPGENGN